MKKFLSLFLIIVFSISFLAGCKKDKGKPPVLPPKESMTIDFSNFNSGKKSDQVSLPKGVENSNWEFAALVAGYFKFYIVTTLAVPVASFDLAIDQKPVYISDKTWQWSFNVSVLSTTYKARLTGQIRTSDVEWNMYISKEGTNPFAEFVWFKGTTYLDGSQGQWILNHSYQFQEPVIQIDWTKTGAGIGTVKYTYIRTLNDSRVADPFKTSYIEYGKTTASYDAYYTIHYYNGVIFSDVNVEWNSATTGHNGRVKCQPFFGDTNWHCWDGNYVNITCP